MKRTVEMDDTLQERVKGACGEIEEVLREWVKENPEEEEAPYICELDYSGGVHEIVDSAVPFYTSEIEDTWYLHRIELTDAYEKAGVGGSPLDNDGMAAIYYYISEQVAEWYSDNAESIVEDARS